MGGGVTQRTLCGVSSSAPRFLETAFQDKLWQDGHHFPRQSVIFGLVEINFRFCGGPYAFFLRRQEFHAVVRKAPFEGVFPFFHFVLVWKDADRKGSIICVGEFGRGENTHPALQNVCRGPINYCLHLKSSSYFYCTTILLINQIAVHTLRFIYENCIHHCRHFCARDSRCVHAGAVIHTSFFKKTFSE